MKVQHDGRSASQTIASTGQEAKRDETIEVDPAVGKKLVEQGWQEASTKTAAKKAATPDPVEKEKE